MKIALPVNNKELSAAMDFSNEIIIATLNNKKLLKKKINFTGNINIKARILKENQIDVVICGIISNTLRMMIEAIDIKIISFICGETNEILDAFCNDNIHCKKYFLPGAYRYRKRFGKRFNN